MTFYVQYVDFPTGLLDDAGNPVTKKRLTMFLTPPADFDAKVAAGKVISVPGQEGMTIDQILTAVKAGGQLMDQAPFGDVIGVVQVTAVTGIRTALGVE